MGFLAPEKETRISAFRCAVTSVGMEEFGESSHVFYDLNMGTWSEDDPKTAVAAFYSQWDGKRTYVNPQTVVRTLQQRRVPPHACILDIGRDPTLQSLAWQRAYSQALTDHGLDSETARRHTWGGLISARKPL